MSIVSPYELTIVHATTGERKTLRVLGLYPREIALQWPMYGRMTFHNKTGQGISKKHSVWSIDSVSLAKLHKHMKELELGPALEDETGQKDIKQTR